MGERDPQTTTKSKAMATIKNYGKEIEDQDCDLMDEIFRVCDLMDERYITKNEVQEYFVAFDDDEVVGFLATNGNRTIVTQVANNYQGQGIGKALVAAAMANGNKQAYLPKQNGCDDFWRAMCRAFGDGEWELEVKVAW